jgi:hypothetical protein
MSLNGALDELIYVTQLPGFEENSGRLCAYIVLLMGSGRLLMLGIKLSFPLYRAEGIIAVLSTLLCSFVILLRLLALYILMLMAGYCAGPGPPGEIDSHYAKLLEQFNGRLLGECVGQVFLGMLHERD